MCFFRDWHRFLLLALSAKKAAAPSRTQQFDAAVTTDLAFAFISQSHDDIIHCDVVHSCYLYLNLWDNPGRFMVAAKLGNGF